jgi:hypothetical protein
LQVANKKPRRSDPAGLFTSLVDGSAAALMYRILGAVRSRVDIGRGAANRVARGNRKSGADQQESHHPAHHHNLRFTGVTMMAWLSVLCLLAVAAVHRVLGAVCDGVDVASGATNRVAGRGGESGTDQYDSENLLDHFVLLCGVRTLAERNGSIMSVVGGSCA